MTIRLFLLAGTMLALLLPPLPAAAGDGAVILAQQPSPESSDKQAPNGERKPQPKQPGAKQEAPPKQPPGARPGAGTPPAAGAPPAGQPHRTQAPVQEPRAPAVGEELKQRREELKQQRPASREEQPGRAPKAPQPPAQRPAQVQPPAAPSQGQPSAVQSEQGQPHEQRRQRGEPAAPTTVQQGQPGQPAAQTPSNEPRRPGQPPRRQPAQVQPGQPQPPAAQTPPTQPQPPAAQGQPTQPPAAQGQPARRQPPAAQTAPTQPQAPAAQGQPRQPQTPAAQGQPSQPQAPAAQGQPTQPQAPAAQRQAPQPATQQSASPTAPPPAQAPAQPAVTARGSILPQPTGSQGQPLRRVDDLRAERREVREGNTLVIREPDRVIIQENNQFIIRHNETNRFLMVGREVDVERHGGEVTTIVERPDGTRVITVTDEDGRLIRRVRRGPDGREIIIIDNREAWQPGVTYYVDLPPPVVRIPRDRYIVEAARATPEIIYETLMAPPVERIDRRYTLEQIRYSEPLRERMPRVDVDTINFEFGSWEIAPDQINRLAVIASAMSRAIARNPGEVFLIEGHTDAVGSDVDNLSLSDRRAESAALALTERFQIPPENLTTQGYGKQYLKIPTQEPERQNRRVTVRRITPLLMGENQSTGQAR